MYESTSAQNSYQLGVNSLISIPLRISTALALAVILCTGCTGLDDEPLAAASQELVIIDSFEIDPSRNYIIAQIKNGSPHTLSSARLKVSLYRESPEPPNSLDFQEGTPEDQALINSKSFLIRNPLKPGYGTEVYYELKMDTLTGTVIYTYSLNDMKGR